MLERGAEGIRAAGLEVAIEPREAALVFRVERRRTPTAAPGRRGVPLRRRGGLAHRGRARGRDPGRSRSAGPRARSCVRSCRIRAASATTIGGAGEFAYHAELGVLRAALGLPRSPFVTRISFTLVDPGARRAREGRPRAARRPRATRRARRAGERRPRSRGGHAHAREHESRSRALAPPRARARRTRSLLRPEPPACGVAGEEPHREALRESRARARQSHRQGSAPPAAAHQYALSARQPQERVLGPFQFTSRFGRAWIDALYAEMPAIASEHVIVHLASDAPSDPESR